MDWGQFKGAYEGLAYFCNIYFNFSHNVSYRCIYRQLKAMYHRRWYRLYGLSLNSAISLDMTSLTPTASEN